MEEHIVRKLSSYENLIARILAEKQHASASEIAAVLYPNEADLRPKISQVSVVLRRMEKKGAVLEARREGKSVIFAAAPGFETSEHVKQVPEGFERPEPPLPTKEMDVKRHEKVEIAVEHAPGEEPKLKQIKTTETTYEVKLRQKEERLIGPEETILKSDHEANILAALKEMREASASDIAHRLFPAEENKTVLVSVYLKRLEEKGFISRTGKIGRKAFYSLAVKPAEEKPEERTKRLGKVFGVEAEVLEKLKELKETSASDLSPIIFPGGGNRTAQMYITLKRLEQKGLITAVRKEGKKTYFIIATGRPLVRLPRITPPKLPHVEIPRIPMRLPPMPHVPRTYIATGISMAVVAIIVFNYGGALGFLGLAPSPLVLSIEQQQTDGLQNFIYGVSNINTHAVREVIVEAILPAGASITDYGGAAVSERNGLTVLTWLISQINPREKHMFSFSGQIPGRIQLYASGLGEQEETQNILDHPVQAILPSSEYGYRALDIPPVGYLGEISVQLSAGPEGTSFTEETVTVPNIPLVNITQNVTVIEVPEQPTENITEIPPVENVTPPVQPPAENITPPIQQPEPNITPPIEQPAPQPNITPPVEQPAPNVTPAPAQPTENITPPLPSPPPENVTPPPVPEQPTPNVTPPVQQPAPPEQIPEEQPPLPPTAGVVTPAVPIEQPALPEQPIATITAPPEPNTTVRIYLDPDTEFNGNEDLIGTAEVFDQFDGTLTAILPAKKYASNMNLVFYSDKGTVVLLKSLSLKWIVEVPVNASQSFLSQYYANVTANATAFEISVVDRNGQAIDAGLSVKDSFGAPVAELVSGEAPNGTKKGTEGLQTAGAKKQKHAFKSPTAKQDIKISPLGLPIKEIDLSGVYTSQNITIGLDDAPETAATPANVKAWSEVYAIDTAAFNFTSGALTAVAKGNALFKCAAWNFSAQRCDGTWEKIMYLTPGAEYSVPISPGDPGFGEANITIINVQSYPTVGGNWTVRFNTTGTADLIIRAVNKTTWSNTNETEDLKFLEVTCGSQAKQYQWINDSVVIPNYSCAENGNETALVLTEGAHYLEFNFGGDVKYAKNYATYQSVLTISGTQELCGDVVEYDKIVVLNGGTIDICAYNGTAGTGWVNITLTRFGGAGNFTVESGGTVDGTEAGARGGDGTTAVNGTQGEDGETFGAGIATTVANGGGGGGGGTASTSGAAGGGGGAFGGAGGRGAYTTTAASNPGAPGAAFGSNQGTLLLAGSGGGGSSSDVAWAGGPGGAGFKVDAGTGFIKIAGTINVNGTIGGSVTTGADTAAGGGGSGGHVILRAFILDISNGIIHASGGNSGRTIGGGNDDCPGGPGGGGRIVYLYNRFTNTSASTQFLAGAIQNAACSVDETAAAAGSVYYASDSFGTAAVYSVAMSDPTTDLTPAVGDGFFMNCTPITGGLPTNVNLSYTYNSSTFSWRPIPTSGSVNLTIITGNGNPEMNVTNNTMYTANVTVQGTGSYNVRCRLYNSTYSANSTSKKITLTPPTTVAWNQSSLNLGSVQTGSSNSSNVTVTATEAHTNVNIYNITGNGTFITATPTALGSMANLEARQIRVNCSPIAGVAAGYYQTIFHVNSTEDTTGGNITASCTVVVPGMAWNQSAVSLSSMEYASAATNVTADATGDNTNANINSLEGNGTFIIAEPSSLGSVSSGQSRQIMISCLPSGTEGYGSYYRTFNVNSTEGTGGNNLTVNCTLNSAWWDSSYGKRDNITITNFNPQTLTDYQVNVTIDTQTPVSLGDLQADCRDVRFVDGGLTQLSYWQETPCNLPNTTFWVKVSTLPGSTTTNITMYYKNPTAANASDGNSTFLYFDDFNGAALNASKWTNFYSIVEVDGPFATAATGYNTPTVDGLGNLTFTGTRTSSDTVSGGGWLGRSVVSRNITEDNFTTEMRVIYSQTGDQYYMPWMGVGQDASNWISDLPAMTGSLFMYRELATVQTAGGYAAAFTPQENVWRRSVFNFRNGAAVTQNSSAVENGVESANFSAGAAYNKKNITISFALRTISSTINMQVDWVFARKFANIQPNASSSLSPSPNAVITFAADPASGTQGGNITFNARYANASSLEPITGATCIVNFTDQGDAGPELPYDNAMSYNSTTGNYTFTRALYRDGTHEANVVCNKTGYTTTSGTAAFSVTSATNWWDTRYDYRQNFTITNNVASDLSYFQVNLTVNTSALIAAGKMNSSCSDIRFANSSLDGIYYWIQDRTCNRVNTTIWVKVPKIPASSTATVTMYYGKGGATAPGSTITETFIFGDDFENTTVLNSDKWPAQIATMGSHAVSNGNLSIDLTVSPGADKSHTIGASVLLSYPNINNYVIESDVIAQNGNSGLGSWPMSGIAVGRRYSGDFWDYAFINGWEAGTTPGYYALHSYTGSLSYSAYSPQPSTNTKYRYYTHVASSSSATTRIGQYQQSSVINIGTDSNYYIELGGQGNAGAKYWFDWLFVRKYATTDPSAAYSGSEESQIAGTAEVKSVTLNAPASDPSGYVGTAFAMNCTAVTGTALSGVNLSFEYNKTGMGWRAIGTSGGVNLTVPTNPTTNVLNSTSYAYDVTPWNSSVYNVRCRLYNSSDSVYSATQQVTVNGANAYSITLNNPAAPTVIYADRQPHTTALNCTGTTNGAPSGINISVEYNDTIYGWRQISDSGMVNITGSNKLFTNVADSTMYGSTITGWTDDTYYVRCRIYNSTYSLYSSAQAVYVWNNTVPSQTNPILNATSVSNLTTDNITCYNRSTSDLDNDTVTTSYNWYKNNLTYAALNMPFNANYTSATYAVTDFSGNKNNGTLGGGNASAVPTWTANGMDGGAYQFDGGDSIVVPDSDSLDATDALTVEAWVNPGTGNAIYEKTITLSPATAVDNYQVKITLNTTSFNYSKAKANGDDIRFYDTNATPLNYWIENWTSVGTSTVWVKAAKAGTDAIYMTYGNPQAPAASNGVNTFELFDDFNDSVRSIGNRTLGNISQPAAGGSIVKVNDTYWMFYMTWESEGWGTGRRATSPDLVHWADQGIITTFGNDEHYDQEVLRYIDNNTAVVYDGKYWMISEHLATEPGILRAYSSTDINSSTWNDEGIVVQKSSTNGDWDENNVQTHTFVQDGNGFYIYYQGLGDDGKWRTGFANSTVPNGIYAKSPLNPVLWPSYQWEGIASADPQVSKFDGVYYLYYTGNSSGECYNTYATSNSLTGNWSKSNVWLTRRGVSYPVVIQHTDGWYYLNGDDLNYFPATKKTVYKSPTPTGPFVNWFYSGVAYVNDTMGGHLQVGNGTGSLATWVNQSTPLFNGSVAIRQRVLLSGTGTTLEIFSGFANDNRSNILADPHSRFTIYTKNNTGSTTSTGIAAPTSYQTYDITWINGTQGTGTANYYQNDTLIATHNSYVPMVPMGATMRSANTTSYERVDWILVRKYSAAEPTATVGNESATIISKGDAYGIGANTTKAFATINNNTINASIGAGWTHIALTYDSGAGSNQQKLYVNGTLAAQGDATGAIKSNSNPLLIGAFFNGTLDEVRVHNRALSATEIQQHFVESYYNKTYAVMTSSELTADDIWKCQATPSDGYADGVTLNSSTLTISGAAAAPAPMYDHVGANTTTPNAFEAVLLYANWTPNEGPLDYAWLATNETGTWQNKTVYGSYLYFGSGSWSNFTWQNNSLDGDTVVAWKIYANDSANNQNVTGLQIFKVGSKIEISLVINNVSFGSLPPGGLNNTTSGIPTPFRIQNDGNKKLNITINASDLFSTAANPSANYRAAANNSSEGLTYTASCTNTTWFNIPAVGSPAKFVCFLDHQNAKDEVEVEIAVTIPNSEPTGAKSSTVTFIATMA